MLSSRIGQIVFVILFWTGALLFLLSLSPFEASTANNSSFSYIEIPKNEFGASTITEWDDFGAITIHFDELSSVSGNLGLFKTAAYKEIELTNLEITAYTGSQLSAVSYSKTYKKKISSSKKSDSQKSICPPQDLPSLFREMKSSTRIDFKSFLTGQPINLIPFTFQFPNCENPAKMTVNGFKFNWYDNSNTKFIIESKRAIYSLLDPSVVQLQGHVIIKTNDSTLESNAVCWDVEGDLFEIQGAYVFRNRDDKKYGHDLCVDSQLNTISSITKSIYKGEKVCRVEK